MGETNPLLTQIDRLKILLGLALKLEEKRVENNIEKVLVKRIENDPELIVKDNNLQRVGCTVIERFQAIDKNKIGIK